MQSGQQARGRSRSALPARRNQCVSGSCSFWNARRPLEDHAVLVPAVAGAVEGAAPASSESATRIRARSASACGRRARRGVGGHVDLPARTGAGQVDVGVAGAVRACSWAADAAGGNGSRLPMHGGQREGRARHLTKLLSLCGGSGQESPNHAPVDGRSKYESRYEADITSALRTGQWSQGASHKGLISIVAVRASGCSPANWTAASRVAHSTTS